MKEKKQQTLLKFKTIIRECYEQLYADKLDNLEEMYKVPRNIQPAKTESKRNSLNRLITRSKIVCVIEKKTNQKTTPC